MKAFLNTAKLTALLGCLLMLAGFVAHAIAALVLLGWRLL